MVNGQFKCLGTAQHLKNKFGEGFALMAKVTPGDDQFETAERTTNLQAFIFQTFSECELKDVHPGLVLYQIGNRNTSLGKVRNTSLGKVRNTSLGKVRNTSLGKVRNTH